MTAGGRFFTIAPDRHFLRVLAREILAGFPDGSGPPPPEDFARWTILVPTRRAARELQRLLLEEAPAQALLLPQIRPIGDIDETLTGVSPAPDPGEALLPPAISRTGRVFELMSLIDTWAKDAGPAGLAGSVRASPAQALALAEGLADLVDTFETENADTDRIAEAYDADIAGHREAILDFLGIVRTHLPARLRQDGLMGPAERRSRMIRLEARRLSESDGRFPVIAAGSTGTIAATRELLAAISSMAHGAVVLPGLDIAADDATWKAIGPSHPQYAMKQLLSELGIARGGVAPLGGTAGARVWLAGEIMRPTETTPDWRHTVSGHSTKIAGALSGIETAEARDRQEEASIIALIMRHRLAESDDQIALVTPDRDLARRVTLQLESWGFAIDDSAGEPLVRTPSASLLALVIDAAMEGHSPKALAALIHHRLANFGLPPQEARAAARHLDIALFRTSRVSPGISHLVTSLERARSEIASDAHAHPAVRRLDGTAWTSMFRLARAIHAALDIPGAVTRPLGAWIDAFVAAAQQASGGKLLTGPGGEELDALIRELQAEQHRHPTCGLSAAAIVVRRHLFGASYRKPAPASSRLAILGLLEARLMAPGTIILGGLNEGIWPAQPDPGPWLNRPMREILGLQQPERAIGQTAHDFVQAFAGSCVFLTWSRRIDNEPAIPSRWILRLQVVAGAAGVDLAARARHDWQRWARTLDAPRQTIRIAKPSPRPPVAARPARLSVTRIETLIRDPYAVYAREVLRLQPIEEIGVAADSRLRGILFHASLGDAFRQWPAALPGNAENILIAEARSHFEPYADDPLVAGFWWPRFRRIARWIAGQEPELRRHLRQSHAETGGSLTFAVAGQPFTLTARADRIDVLADGTARILDFKTGQPPSAAQVDAGLAPQLTLEAAILAAGGFPGIAACDTSELIYVRITGGEPPGELKRLSTLQPMDAAARHLAGLKRLLGAYAVQSTPYLPRYAVEKEEDPADYDHLSRYREWVLAGDGS